MKYFVFLSVISVAAAARLENIYLPTKSDSSGADAGLQTPFEPESVRYQPSGSIGSYQSAGSSGTFQGSAGPGSYQSSNQAQILRYENEQDDQGWHYAYETSDGTKAEQNGRIIPGSVPEEGSLAVSGSFSYIGDDGKTYSVSYTADENGFHPTGEHLPTPPPIPEDILKSLQLTAGSDDKYNSHKSSYDADAGY